MEGIASNVKETLTERLEIFTKIITEKDDEIKELSDKMLQLEPTDTSDTNIKNVKQTLNERLEIFTTIISDKDDEIKNLNDRIVQLQKDDQYAIFPVDSVNKPY